MAVASSGSVRARTLLRYGLLLAAIPAAAAERPALDLASLLAEAEASAPSLRSSASRVREAESLPSQAEALPDPMLSFALQNESLDAFTLGDTEMSNATLTWTQELPYRGKRARRAAAAQAESGVASADALRIRFELRSRIKAAYVELHRLHRTRILFVENRGLLLALRDASRARFETGGAPLEGTLGAGAEIARLDAELAAIDGARAQVEARLAALLGRRATGPFGDAVVPPIELPYEPETLAIDAASGSTEVAVLRAAAKREEARIEALRLEEKPDFSWSAGYAYRGSLDPMVMGMVGVRLPLFRDAKQRGAVTEAEHALDAVRHETEEAEIEAAAAVHEVLALAAAAAARARVLEDAVVPQARAALDAATAAYATSRVDFATVLDYARALLADARMLEDLNAERLTALAALEPSIGRELVVPGRGSP